MLQCNSSLGQIAFMGDDTWMALFPTSFAPNMTHPFDSFNVEDLHTVDEGVIRHLFPLLKDPSKPWDFLIGHCLGVDHVGHRIGPDHPTMKAKLEQMDEMVRGIVELLDDDTLFVLLGDHGMDTKGDHGGDGELETSASLWIYSKNRRLVDPNALIPPSHTSYHTYPGTTVPHRRVQQIDLVPSLSLMLGLQIPFNNLGTVIPELFWDDLQGTRFERALELNAAQIKSYLDTYRSSTAGSELDGAWSRLQELWAKMNAVPGEIKWEAMNGFTRFALATCRLLWAQFNVSLMTLGLTLLVVGSLATWSIYRRLGELGHDWETQVDTNTRTFVIWTGIGSVSGLLAFFPLRSFVKGVGLLELGLFGAGLASSAAVVSTFRSPISLHTLKLRSFPLLLVLHALAFLSNSFILWEDHAVTYLLLTSLVPSALTGFTAPTSRLRTRILGFSGLFAVCVRLIAVSTVCREEQQPYCDVTFFASSSITVPPTPVLIIAIPAAVGLPWIVRSFLQISKSDRGLASVMLPLVLPTILLLGTLVWVVEWMDVAEILGSSMGGFLRISRSILAWAAMSTTCVIGFTLWWKIPLCLEVKANKPQTPTGKTEVTVLGFANSFGSSFLIFWLIFLSLIYTTTQLTGQVVLVLAAIALLSYLEVLDSVRDVRKMNLAFSSSTPSTILQQGSVQSSEPEIDFKFPDVFPLALLAIHTFHGTGHQSTISSIQWKSAFLLTSTLTYPFSPLLVFLNTFGPVLLFSLATPLLVLWNVAPLPHPTTSLNVRKHSIRASLAMMLYFGLLLLSSAISSAWLRRHLMVWKVFSPRFMNAAISLLVIDVAVIIALGLGLGRVEEGLQRLFRGMPTINEQKSR